MATLLLIVIYIAFIGSVFPNLIYLTPINFGEDISQSIMGSQMAAAYIGVMTIPSIFGLIADNLGANFLPFYVILLFVIKFVQPEYYLS